MCVVEEASMTTSRIQLDPRIMLGKPVVRGTRIPVEQVGMMLKRGATQEELLEDWPYLTNVDLEFARIWVELSPPRGRPLKPIQFRRATED